MLIIHLFRFPKNELHSIFSSANTGPFLLEKNSANYIVFFEVQILCSWLLENSERTIISTCFPCFLK